MIEKFSYRSNRSYSRISTELFDKLSEAFPDNNFRYAQHEVRLRCTREDGSVVILRPDFYDPDTKKSIEFLGDYWHKNAESFPNLPYEELLEQFTADLDRFQLIQSHERISDLYIIWESEYVSDKDGSVQMLIDYLKQTK